MAIEERLLAELSANGGRVSCHADIHAGRPLKQNEQAA